MFRFFRRVLFRRIITRVSFAVFFVTFEMKRRKLDAISLKSALASIAERVYGNTACN